VRGDDGAAEDEGEGVVVDGNWTWLWKKGK